MNVHYLQHVPFEGLGYIESWLKDNGHTISSTCFYEEDYQFPDISAIDAVIIMGGPMGVYDEDKYSWLFREKVFIEDSIKANKKVLGICLGAQLLAISLGAKVVAATNKEIGWFPVTPTEEGEKLPWLYDLFINSPMVFHWHGDKFEIPRGGSLDLLGSFANDHQAFYYNEHVIGLQFHLEVTQNNLMQMIENGQEELQQSPFVQSEKELIKGVENIKTCNALMSEILNKWL